MQHRPVLTTGRAFRSRATSIGNCVVRLKTTDASTGCSGACSQGICVHGQETNACSPVSASASYPILTTSSNSRTSVVFSESEDAEGVHGLDRQRLLPRPDPRLVQRRACPDARGTARHREDIRGIDDRPTIRCTPRDQPGQRDESAGWQHHCKPGTRPVRMFRAGRCSRRCSSPTSPAIHRTCVRGLAVRWNRDSASCRLRNLEGNCPVRDQIDKTRTPVILATIQPDADPAKNNWNVGSGHRVHSWPPLTRGFRGRGRLERQPAWPHRGPLLPDLLHGP